MSQVSGIVFVFVIAFVFVLVIVFVVGQVISPHHSDQMSQRSQVSRVTLLLCFSKGVNKFYVSLSLSLCLSFCGPVHVP